MIYMAGIQPQTEAERAYRVFQDAKQAYEDAVAVTHTNTGNIVVLNFKALQLLRIKTLQQELFDLQMRLQFGGFTADEYNQKLTVLDTTLTSYGQLLYLSSKCTVIVSSQSIAQALQNYETLAQNSLDYIPDSQELFGTPRGLAPYQPPDNDGHFGTRRSNKRYTEFRLSGWTKYTLSGQNALGGGDYVLNRSLKFRELDRDGREARARKSALVERFAMALFGGVALIAPMLVMTLHPTQTTSLVTVSVATLLFALILAVFAKETAGKDVLAATAAYAAVLVVFIGTSTSTTPSSSNGQASSS